MRNIKILASWIVCALFSHSIQSWHINYDPHQVGAGYDHMPPFSPELMSDGKVPIKPKNISYELTRGIPSNPATIKSLAQLKISIEPFEFIPYDWNAKLPYGYDFEVIGTSINPKIFPSHPAYPNSNENETHVFIFRWGDNANFYQQPIDIKLNIYTVNEAGQRSEPYSLNIFSEGIKVSKDLKNNSPIKLEHIGNIEKYRPIEGKYYEVTPIYKISDE